MSLDLTIDEIVQLNQNSLQMKRLYTILNTKVDFSRVLFKEIDIMDVFYTDSEVYSILYFLL
jgi:hypothetical protein